MRPKSQRKNNIEAYQAINKSIIDFCNIVLVSFPQLKFVVIFLILSKYLCSHLPFFPLLRSPHKLNKDKIPQKPHPPLQNKIVQGMVLWKRIHCVNVKNDIFIQQIFYWELTLHQAWVGTEDTKWKNPVEKIPNLTRQPNSEVF